MVASAQRGSISVAVIFLLLGLCSTTFPTSFAEGARLKQSPPKGHRNKGWRRRAEDYEAALEQNHKVTIITNPSTLGKGKGKGGGGYVYNSEDDNGRTTFLINCAEARAAKQAAEKSGIVKSGVKAVKGEAVPPPPAAEDVSAKIAPKVGPAPPEDVSAKIVPKVGPGQVCDGYEPETDVSDGENVGGWQHGEGQGAGDGEYDGEYDGGSDGGGYDGGSDGGSDTGIHGGSYGGNDGGNDNEYPAEDNNNGVGNEYDAVENGYGGLSSCPDIAAGNGPKSGTSILYEVTLDVIKEEELPSVGIMRLMKADLQFNVAPLIADCSGGSYGSDGSNDGSSGGSDGSSGGTLITDVVFQDLSEDQAGCSAEYIDDAAMLGGECLKTSIPVILYYDGDDTSGFLERVQNAIDNHEWNVPGLMKTSDVDKDDGASIAAIEVQENKEDDTIGPAGYMTLAAAALVLLLLAVMMARRQRRNEMVKHVELGDDGDDETYLRDMDAESVGSSPNRLARVVGDDDSIQTGLSSFHGASQFPTDGYFANTESHPSHQDVHVCSSATCEVCERNRQAGVQFIPSGTNLAHPPMPPDEPREYSADDTVNL